MTEIRMSQAAYAAIRDEILPHPYGLKPSEIEAILLRAILKAMANQRP